MTLDSGLNKSNCPGCLYILKPRIFVLIASIALSVNILISSAEAPGLTLLIFVSKSGKASNISSLLPLIIACAPFSVKGAFDLNGNNPACGSDKYLPKYRRKRPKVSPPAP